MMVGWVGFGTVAVVLSGCFFPEVPPPEQDPPEGSAPDAGPTFEPDLDTSPGMVAAKEIRAERVYAAFIFAKDIHAGGGEIDLIVEDRDEERWEDGRSDAVLVVPELRAHTIYAKTIRTTWIEADEAHAKQVKLPR